MRFYAQHVHTHTHSILCMGCSRAFWNPSSRNTRKATAEGSRQEYPERQQPHENRILWPLNKLKKTWKSWATEEERRRSKGRRSRCGIISWTWIGYSKQMIISKKSQPELFLVEQIIFKKSEPFLIEASWHPSSFIPFSDFSHDAMCSFRHRATHGETGWRSPAPFAGGRPSCHRSGCPSGPSIQGDTVCIEMDWMAALT